MDIIGGLKLLLPVIYTAANEFYVPHAGTMIIGLAPFRVVIIASHWHCRSSAPMRCQFHVALSIMHALTLFLSAQEVWLAGFQIL